MKFLTTSCLMVLGPFLAVAASQSRENRSATSRIEVRAETVVNRDGGLVEACEVVQTKSASAGLSFAAWGTFGEKALADAEPSGPVRESRPRREVGHCGAGTFPGGAPTSSGQAGAPVLINQVSADVSWASGTMDPGPVGAIVVALTVTSRHLTGFSQDGQPQYSAPITDRRSTRLEPGEEYVAPVRLEAHERESLGIQDVLIRVRAGWAGREGATDYGTLVVIDAAPGSDIFLDGGLAGRAGGDGSLTIARVPVGLREVRLRGTSRSTVSRSVSVVKGRAVAVAPITTAGTAPSRPAFAATGKNPEGFQEYRRLRDGALMVLIPEGEFLMGNLETEGAPLPHTVYVSSFLMDKLPVTVGLFKRFAAASGRPLPPDPYWGVRENSPVAFVRWDEAKAYCEWAGGRLPTEAEREKATRGTDGRLWPWGSEPPTPDRGVFRGNWGLDGNDTVGARPTGASPYGLLDTGGNMWEFCEDWWDVNYFKSSPLRDPSGPKTGVARVVKGGSWDSRPTVLSASSRNFAYTGYREGDFGFRCAADPIP